MRIESFDVQKLDEYYYELVAAIHTERNGIECSRYLGMISSFDGSLKL